MAEQTVELLDDGTPLTDDVVDTLVADVYIALDQGAYKVIPNPHGPRSPLKVPPHLRSALQDELVTT